MATIVTRVGKGSPLSFTEVDDNFTNLNTDKEETINSLPLDTVMSATADYISFYDTAATSVKKIVPANSVFFNRTVVIKVLGDTIPTYVQEGISFFTIPSSLNDLYLSGVSGEVGAHVYTAGTTGTTTVMLYNETDSVDMLSTGITIDTGETDSSTAAAAPVVDTSNNQVSTADVIRFDIDTIQTGTAANGLEVRMQFVGSS
jgi:hypothetical protein